MRETILIYDFGSQYTQLIARRVRELSVYCEIHPYHKKHENNSTIKGIILSGSPYSVRDNDSPKIDLSSLKGKVPILGICYGAQLIAHNGHGKVIQSKIREYGRANLSFIEKKNLLFKSIKIGSQVWMSHGDTIAHLPANAEVIASTKDVKIAGFQSKNEQTYGIQFHPEVYHTTEGKKIIKNFLVDICKCSQNWTPESFIATTISDLNKVLSNDKVVLGVSGGVDSTVCAVLLNKAIGKNLHCIFIDNGLLRKNEYAEVLDYLLKLGLNVKGVEAEKYFLNKLKGVTDPEMKRKIIGRVFIEVFEREAKKIQGVKWLAQGTIYPDVIESVSALGGPSAKIKSHHNVGGLPERMNLKIVEPLRMLFKDEIRCVGEKLNISKKILNRHPFPGPGLAVRIIGEITKEKVKILQDVDDIFIMNLKSSGLYEQVWQAGAILLPVQSVGVMGDERSYESVVALRSVNSTDGMTADWSQLPFDFLAKVSNEIINKVKGVNRVVYDISSKPPATIEWE